MGECHLRPFCWGESNKMLFPHRYKSNGKSIDYFPSTVSELANVEPEYITLPGWETSIENVREFDHLPKRAQEYVQYIENYVGVPVRWVGVGKGRESIISITN